MSGTRKRGREQNFKLRAARLEWQAEAAEPMTRTNPGRVSPVWFRTTRANKPHTKHDPQQNAGEVS